MPRLNPNKEERKKNSQRYSANQELIKEVQPFLKCYFQDPSCLVSNMTLLSKIIYENFGLKLDRQAKRFKSQFFCWFAENWTIIKSFLLQHPWETLTSHITIERSLKTKNISSLPSSSSSSSSLQSSPIEAIS